MILSLNFIVLFYKTYRKNNNKNINIILFLSYHLLLVTKCIKTEKEKKTLFNYLKYTEKTMYYDDNI